MEKETIDMFTCKYCDKQFASKIGLGTHMKQYCEKAKTAYKSDYENMQYECDACNKKFENKNSLHGHKSKCAAYKLKLKNILSFNFLYDNLITNNFTAHHIATKILNGKVTASMIIWRAKELNIKTKTNKETANLESVRNMYEKTCLEKYGAVNTLSKNTLGYNKRNVTVKEKYNVDNVFQLKTSKEKSKKTMYENHGVEYAAHIPGLHRNTGRKSKIHILIENILDSFKIQYLSEENKIFLKYNDELKKEYCPRPDILVSNKKIVIEINGDRWHANPKLYKSSDVISIWRGMMRAEEIWANEAIRIRHIESFGYKVVILWEYDILHNIEQIKSEILSICKM